MKLIYTFCCCALVLFTFKAQAQTDSTSTTDDYVITIKGDTLKCFVSNPLIGGNRYTLPGSDESQKMDIKQIKEYYITRKDLRKRAVLKDKDKKPTLMTVVENGRISLYEAKTTSSYGFSNSFVTTTTQWYVGKDSDRVSYLKTSSIGINFGKSHKDRKDDLGDMLKDKPDVYNKYIAQDKFSFKEIQDIVHLYNTGEGEAKKHDSGIMRTLNSL